MANAEGKKEAINVNDLFSIRGKVALVTGGSRGIGHMIARGYVEAGARVYISSRKKDVCDQVAKELSEIGECISIPADISAEEDRKLLVDKISEQEQSLHILVNNAGANWGAPISEYPDSGFDKVMSLNVKSMFALTRDLLPLLEKAVMPGDPARVINIGSIDGIMVPIFENYAYSASKAAVHHLTRALAVNLGPRGITVNAVAPGPFESKMTEWMLENFRGQIEERCPLSRIGTPGDIAGITIYLASRASSFVTGTVIPVDGGLRIAS
ncbi:MAG: SDR family oxidoreductase [Thermodesulfobacteriota bacterium]|nr:SDR family oxidoreductase [Thermodesulfobacteriota bacterium]